MEAKALGPLRVRVVVKSPGAAPRPGPKGPLTVVLMHGYGAPGDDLIDLAGGIEAPAGTTFVFPEAPSVLADPRVYGDARQWWPIDIGRFERAARQGTVDALTRDEPEGLAAAREALVGMLDALEEQTKTPGDRIVVGGFSQGSMLATDVALRTRRPLAGLVVLSGTLLAADAWLPQMKERAGLPVFQTHGTSDPLLPYAVAERLRDALDQAGLRVSFTSFEGGHGIPPTVMRDLGAWLTNVA